MVAVSSHCGCLTDYCLIGHKTRNHSHEFSLLSLNPEVVLSQQARLEYDRLNGSSSGMIQLDNRRYRSLRRKAGYRKKPEGIRQSGVFHANRVISA